MDTSKGFTLNWKTLEHAQPPVILPHQQRKGWVIFLLDGRQVLKSGDQWCESSHLCTYFFHRNVSHTFWKYARESLPDVPLKKCSFKSETRRDRYQLKKLLYVHKNSPTADFYVSLVSKAFKQFTRIVIRISRVHNTNCILLYFCQGTNIIILYIYNTRKWSVHDIEGPCHSVLVWLNGGFLIVYKKKFDIEQQDISHLHS